MGESMNALNQSETPTVESRLDLIQDYLSDQISERQWFKHCQDDPGLEEMWKDYILFKTYKFCEKN